MSPQLRWSRGWLIAALLALAAVAAVIGAGFSRTAPNTAAPNSAGPVPRAADHPPLASAKVIAPAAPEMPKNHPPVRAKPRTPPERSAREGKVEVDAARPYTHYRVGNHSVRTIFADGGVLWLGTSGGIARFDLAGREFRLYDTRNGLAASGVYYLGKLRGRIAAGTHGGGLSILDEAAQTWSHFRVPEGLAGNTVHHALQASNGDIWIGTEAGANRVRGGALEDPTKWERHTSESSRGGLPHDAVYVIAQGADGAFWFATEGGLARLHNGKWASWPAASPAEAVIALEAARSGAVWAGLRGGGLARVQGGARTTYALDQGLPSAHVSSLHFDRKNRLWVGTRSGLALYSGGKFEVMGTAQGLIAEGVHAVTTTTEGDLWVAGFGGVAQIRNVMKN
jgi:ligand-binding sensor domain-containing protein